MSVPHFAENSGCIVEMARRYDGLCETRMKDFWISFSNVESNAGDIGLKRLKKRGAVTMYTKQDMATLALEKNKVIFAGALLIP